MSRALAAAAALVASAALAACGSSSSNSTSKSASPKSTTPASSSSGSGAYGSAKSPSASASSALTAHRGSLGTFVVDAKGRTLYLFEKDKGSKSTCYGSCTSVWPPATTTGTPKPGAGLKTNLLGTTKRTDGSTELTYGGHPLYRYAGDQKPGDAKGQGLNQFAAKWYVVRPSGRKLDSD